MHAGNTNWIYNNDLDKTCFQHNSTNRKYKNLTKRTQSDEFLRDKAFKTGSDPKYAWYQRRLASMVYKFLDKKSTGSGIKSMSNKKFADELQQPIISKFKRRRVYSSFKDNIWVVDLADMQLISKYNKGIRFLLWEIDLFSKYAWIVPERTKKELLLLMHFRVFQTIRKENQTKHGLIKIVNLITIHLKNC